MFKFTPMTIPNNVFVIGAGGTGSRLMPLLAQFLRTITRGQSPTGWLESPNIWVVDDDIVEEKNLTRQNFIRQDTGKHKAIVVADRYSRAYGTNIYPITQRIVSDVNDNSLGYRLLEQEVKMVLTAKHNLTNDTSALAAMAIHNSIVIICVDSAKARRDILNAFLYNPGHQSHQCESVFFIDAGNEDSFGQVSFFNPVLLTDKERYEAIERNNPQNAIPKILPYEADFPYLPMDLEYYISLEDTKSTASCADLNQTLAINALMAVNIMGVVQNYYYRKPFKFNTIRIDLDGGNRTEFNSFTNFKSKALTSSRVEALSWDSVYKTPSGDYLHFGSRVHQINLVGDGGPYRLLKAKIDAEAERVRKEREKEELAAKLAAIKAEKERVEKERLAAEETERQRILAETMVAYNSDSFSSSPPLVPISTSPGDLTPEQTAALVVDILTGNPSAPASWVVPGTTGPVTVNSVTTPNTTVTSATPALQAIPRVRRPRPVVELERVNTEVPAPGLEDLL